MIYQRLLLPDTSTNTFILEYKNRHLLGPITNLLLGNLEEKLFIKTLDYPNNDNIKIYCYHVPDTLKKYSIFEELTQNQIIKIESVIINNSRKLSEATATTAACLLELLEYNNNSKEDTDYFLTEILFWFQERLKIIDKKLVE